MARPMSVLASLPLGALLLSAQASPTPASLTPATLTPAGLTPFGSAAERCADLPQRARDAWPDASTEITSASLHAASAAGGPTAPALPEHCELSGRLHARTGVDGQHYAIQFHMRLPTSWNGRFLFQGGGGSDGAVGDAIGAIGPGMPSALARGFAVLSQDSGHDNRTNNDPAHQGTIARLKAQGLSGPAGAGNHLRPRQQDGFGLAGRARGLEGECLLPRQPVLAKV